MTRQYASRNNVTISMPGGRSVPIVSQTEIDPMKTALSLNACAHHDDGAHRATAHTEAAGAGRLVPARLYRERLILHPVAACCGRHRQAEQRHLPVGMGCVGLLLLVKWPRPALALRSFVFSCRGHAVPRGLPPRHPRIGSPEAGMSKRGHGRARGSSA